MTWKLVRTGLYSSTLLLNALCSHYSFAGNMGNTNVNENGWFLGLGGGWLWPSVNKSTTVPNGSYVLSISNKDFYTINSPGSTGESSTYGGYRFALNNPTFPYFNLALRYQYLSNFNVNGLIEQYSLPRFNNYNYRLNLSSNIFTVQSTLDFYQYGPFSSYFSTGLGMGSSRLSGYKEQAVAGVIPRISPAYQNNTANNFTFNLGAGIDYQINPQVWVSLGYEYTNLGTINSNNGTGANWTNEFLSLGTLTTNAIILGVYYQLS
ncbi:MAG: outer membrane beta-barrel protein [Gammaproteobacteria bacterium]